MKTEISIIIPCYNSESTLEEAVNSCYKNKLSKPFEIIIVDDGSKDNTKNIILRLSERYSEIRHVFHPQNLGGGAARNTGIKESKGEYIFCLDSDNVLDVNSFNNAIDFLIENQVDGVAFHERRFFRSKNINNFSSHFNPINKNSYTLDNLFDRSGTLLDNFIFTKKSYELTDGYPEHHGFDTQCFEMRFLNAGNTVLACPKTFFYHRQNNDEPSYFEREYNKGNFSINYYLSIEDIWSKLSFYAKKIIINYDIFKNSTLQNNLLVRLEDIYAEKKLLITQNDDTRNDNDEVVLYNKFIKNYKDRNFHEALKSSEQILGIKKENTNKPSELKNKIVYFNILRCSIGITGEKYTKIESGVSNLILGLKTESKKLNKWYHKNRLLSTTIKLIQKIKHEHKN